MSTDVFICNLALGHCGSKRIIQDLGEGSTEADLCQQYFEHARDAFVESEEWGFATAYKTLALLPDDPDTEAWEYAYDYPEDCLKIRYINNGAVYFQKSLAVPYEIGLNDDGNGRVILTNQNTAKICYTKKITNSAVFSSVVASALAAKLATYINMPLTQDANQQQLVENAYIILKAEAVAADSNEHEEGVELESSFVTARTR